MKKPRTESRNNAVTICTEIGAKKTKIVVDRPYMDIYNDEAVVNETAEP